MSSPSPRRLMTACAVALILLPAFVLWQGRPDLSQQVVPSRNTDWSCRKHDAELGIAIYEPECTGTRDVGEGAAELMFNKGGFRGDPPRQGATKVLLLGGATLLGPGLGNKHEPGALLEAEFKTQGHDIDVLNLSVEGYTTTQHALRLKTYLLKHKPKLVLFDTLSGHKMFLDRMLLEQVVQNDAGLLRKIRTQTSGTTKLFGQLFGSGMRSWLRTWEQSNRNREVSQSLENSSQAELAQVLATCQRDLLAGALAVARKRGTEVRLIWDNSIVENDRALRVHEASGPARVVSAWTPKLTVGADAMTTALREETLPLLMPQHLPQPSEADLYQGDSPYYSAKGMRRFARSVASALSAQGILDPPEASQESGATP